MLASSATTVSARSSPARSAGRSPPPGWLPAVASPRPPAPVNRLCRLACSRPPQRPYPRVHPRRDRPADRCRLIAFALSPASTSWQTWSNFHFDLDEVNCHTTSKRREGHRLGMPFMLPTMRPAIFGIASCCQHTSVLPSSAVTAFTRFASSPLVYLPLTRCPSLAASAMTVWVGRLLLLPVLLPFLAACLAFFLRVLAERVAFFWAAEAKIRSGAGSPSFDPKKSASAPARSQPRTISESLSALPFGSIPLILPAGFSACRITKMGFIVRSVRGSERAAPSVGCHLNAGLVSLARHRAVLRPVRAAKGLDSIFAFCSHASPPGIARLGWGCAVIRPTSTVMAMLAATFFLTCAAPAATMRNFKVGDWVAGAYSDDGTREFSHCAASGMYGSGISVVFSINRDFHWSMGFAHPGWKLRPGEVFDIAFTVDDMQPILAKARAKMGC